ncbi:hypothetical protein COOONC_26680 [Cooperia oncophora]
MVDSVEVIGPRLAILRLRIDKRTFYVVGDFNAVIHEGIGVYIEPEKQTRTANVLMATALHGKRLSKQKKKGIHGDGRGRVRMPRLTAKSTTFSLTGSGVCSTSAWWMHSALGATIGWSEQNSSPRNTKTRLPSTFSNPYARHSTTHCYVVEAVAAHYTWQEAQDLSQDYTMLIEGLLHCAMASLSQQGRIRKAGLDDKARHFCSNALSSIASRARIEEIAVNFYTDSSDQQCRFRAYLHLRRTLAPLIKEWEVEHAFRQMKPRKAPGPDRISADFLESASAAVINSQEAQVAWT